MTHCVNRGQEADHQKSAGLTGPLNSLPTLPITLSTNLLTVALVYEEEFAQTVEFPFRE